MRFDTRTNYIQVWDGQAWQTIAPTMRSLPEWPMMDWTCHFRTPHTVEFPDTHVVRENSAEVVIWALMNCRGLYRFYSHRMPEAYRVPEPSMDDQRAAWAWEFTDANDAFHFKMRWL